METTLVPPFDFPAALKAYGTDTQIGAALGLSGRTVSLWRLRRQPVKTEYQCELAALIGVPVAYVATWCAVTFDRRARSK